MYQLWPSIKAAVAFANKGVEEDKKGNYEEALRLYKEAEANYLHAIEYDATYNFVKNGLRNKCKKYQDRTVQLTLFLEKKARRL